MNVEESLSIIQLYLWGWDVECCFKGGVLWHDVDDDHEWNFQDLEYRTKEGIVGRGLNG
jgi:hypothetical protein